MRKIFVCKETLTNNYHQRARTQRRRADEVEKCFTVHSALLLLLCLILLSVTGIEVVFIFCSAIVKLLCKGIAINTVISAERNIGNRLCV